MYFFPLWFAMLGGLVACLGSNRAPASPPGYPQAYPQAPIQQLPYPVNQDPYTRQQVPYVPQYPVQFLLQMPQPSAPSAYDGVPFASSNSGETVNMGTLVVNVPPAPEYDPTATYFLPPPPPRHV